MLDYICIRVTEIKTLGYCGVEQLVARRAHNPKATGSSPVPATKEKVGIITGFFYVQFFSFHPIFSIKSLHFINYL